MSKFWEYLISFYVLTEDVSKIENGELRLIRHQQDLIPLQ